MKIPTAYLAMLVLGFVASFAAVAAGQNQEGGWKPIDPPMLTRWAKDIDPKAPLPEYPRPQVTRAQWQNLNGLWQYAVTGKDAAASGPATWDGRILVPFPIESSLSGVKGKFLPDQTLWYERTFDVPDDWDGKRVILHFGAVDYAAEVFVNGVSVGTHVGGYDPFHFDITDRLNGAGEQTLRVKVTDPTWTGGQPRGKQTLNPRGIMYTPTSGIWQTVWIEPVAQGGVEDLRIVPDLESKSVKVSVDLFGNAEGDVTVSVGGGRTATGKAGQTVVVPVDDPKLWTPDDPHLYEMTVTVARDGKEADKVGSYFGMRSIRMAEVDGAPQLLLNGKPIFMFGPLDQGFWPDGVYTAPTDEALKYDLEITKKLGFNTTRKHIKVEPARWYHHADKLGLLVWQDMPSANSYDAGDVPGGRPAVDNAAYETQLRAMIDNLENHPAIVMWIIFNESQGKHDTARLVKLVRELDPSRLVNEDSGFQDHGGRYQGVGDLYDMHPYPAPRAFDAPPGKAFALGEYGGIGLKVGANNPWQTAGWGYTNVRSPGELEDLYAQYAGLLRRFREKNRLTSAIYTQLTDVEIEINGLLTYDRQLKADPEWIRKANRFEWAGPTYETVVPTSQEQSQTYRYTFEQPADGWQGAGFDASGWKTGPGGFGTKMTPNTGIVGTEWNTKQIWLRRTFNPGKLNEDQLKRLVLSVYHDEDVTVYLNGQPIFEAKGFISNYAQVPLDERARSALKVDAENVLAVTCKQTTGGQYVDVGLSVKNPNR